MGTTIRKAQKSYLKIALCGFLALVAVFCSTKPAAAQRATRVYGSAYTPAWTRPPFWQYSPSAHVTFWDDSGHRYECNTNWRSDWWYDNIPTNRWYTFQARSNTWPYYSSSTTRVWVGAQAWWQVNQVRIPDLQCRN